MINTANLVDIKDNQVLLKLICTLVHENERLQRVIIELQKRRKSQKVTFSNHTISRAQSLFNPISQES